MPVRHSDISYFLSVWLPLLAYCRGCTFFSFLLSLKAVMDGDVVQAMSLANEMDPMMLDRDRCE